MKTVTQLTELFTRYICVRRSFNEAALRSLVIRNLMAVGDSKKCSRYLSVANDWKPSFLRSGAKTCLRLRKEAVKMEEKAVTAEISANRNQLARHNCGEPAGINKPTMVVSQLRQLTVPSEKDGPRKILLRQSDRTSAYSPRNHRQKLFSYRKNEKHTVETGWIWHEILADC